MKQDLFLDFKFYFLISVIAFVWNKDRTIKQSMENVSANIWCNNFWQCLWNRLNRIICFSCYVYDRKKYNDLDIKYGKFDCSLPFYNTVVSNKVIVGTSLVWRTKSKIKVSRAHCNERNKLVQKLSLPTVTT